MKRHRRHTIVLNFHGGFPSCMIDRSFENLLFFKNLSESTHDSFTRVYPEYADRETQWKTFTKRIFPFWKTENFKTVFIGSFGIEEKYHPCHPQHPLVPETVLREWSIDHAYEIDTEFAPGSSLKKDINVLKTSCELFQKKLQDENRNIAMVVNLLGCRDVTKVSCAQSFSHSPVKPSFLENDLFEHYNVLSRDVFSENRFPENISQSFETSDSDYNKQMKMESMLLHNDRGLDASPLSSHVAEVCQKISWKYLQNIDTKLCEFWKNIETMCSNDDVDLYVFADHALSMYEHLIFEDSSWESCLRTFAMIPKMTSYPHKNHNIYSLSDIYNDIEDKIKNKRSRYISNNCVTSRFLYSSVAETKTPFFIRFVSAYKSRIYSFTFWFGEGAILHQNNIHSSNVSDYIKKGEWFSPDILSIEKLHIHTFLHVYDLTSDHDEIYNLSLHKDWIKTKCAVHLLQVWKDVKDKKEKKSVLLRRDYTMGQVCTRIEYVNSYDDVEKNDSSCQTESININELDIPTYMMHWCEGIVENCTIFVPEKEVSVLPSWLIKPIKGAFAKDKWSRTVQELKTNAKIKITHIGKDLIQIDSMVIGFEPETRYVFHGIKIYIYLARSADATVPLKSEFITLPSPILDTVSEPASPGRSKPPTVSRSSYLNRQVSSTKMSQRDQVLERGKLRRMESAKNEKEKRR